MKEGLLFAAGTLAFLGLLICIAYQSESSRKNGVRERFEGPCQDESSLLATTAGSPNSFKCPNRRHVMEVKVATTASREEVAALVFCRCVREGKDGGVK